MDSQEKENATSSTQSSPYPIPDDTVLFESSRHRFNWSTEFPKDARKSSRKNTIYQLMLDTRVELKSGGNKIYSTRPPHSASKKRKKNLSGSLTENGLPDMANRAPVVTEFELAINSFQIHKLRSYFETYAVENIAFQVDMSALSPVPSMMIYREVRGIPTIISYLHIYNQVIPDGVQLFWQKSTRKTENGCKEIETSCRMIGTKFYEILVQEDLSYQEEQQILEAAIFGLTSLAKPTIRKTDEEDRERRKEEDHHHKATGVETTKQLLPHQQNTLLSSSQQQEENKAPAPAPAVFSLRGILAAAAASSPTTETETSTSTTSSNTHQSDTTSKDSLISSFSSPSLSLIPPVSVDASSSTPQNKNIRSLDAINILMANEKVEFSIGERLPKPQVMDVSGKFVWYLNAQRKITRMKFVLDKPEPPAMRGIGAMTEE